MADVAQILGVQSTGNKGANAAGLQPPRRVPSAAAPPPPPQTTASRAAQKVQGAALSREVLNLIAAGDYHSAPGGGSGGPATDGFTHGAGGAGLVSLPPAVPTFTSSAASRTVSEIFGNGRTSPVAGGVVVGGSKSQKQVKVGSKWIRCDKPARKWAWAPFVSSARTDGAVFCHWVRAGVEYPDYPYSRFDIHLDPVTYTDEEYRRHLASDTWTQSETDNLMELARIYELRWAVIHDRWLEHQALPRKVEDLQHRYYWVAAKLSQIRISHEAAQEVQALVNATPNTLSAADDPSKIVATENLLIEAAAARALASVDGPSQPLISNLGTGSTNKVFDVEAERERRAYWDALWNRSKEEEIEELEIRNELKQVDAQLRKLKKSGAHIVAAAGTLGPGASTASASAPGVGGVVAPFAAGLPSTMTSLAPSAASSRNPSRSVSPTTAANLIDSALAAVDHALNSAAPIPTARTPYLQSGRLSNPAAGGGGGPGTSTGASSAATVGSSGINKSLLARMDAVLAELHVDPAALVPTKRVCDLNDVARRDILTLLILQKNLFQKEAVLESKRLKLAKMGGSLSQSSGASASAPVMDEEALMGIVPPHTQASAAVKAASAGPPNRGTASGAGGLTTASGKAKGSAGGKQLKAPPGKAKHGSKAKASSDDASNPGSKKGGPDAKDENVVGGKPRKPAMKRKRKTETTAPEAATGSSAKLPTAAGAAGSAPSAPGSGGGAKERSTAVPAAAAAAAAPVATPSSGSAAPKSDESKQAKKRAKKAAPSAS